MTRIGWVMCLWVSTSAGCAGRIPLPEHLRVSGPAELIERMEKARTPVQGFVAEARTTYFGPAGRLKGSVILAAVRPARLRYDLMGPQGTVLEAFATDGTSMQWMSVGQELFVRGPATVENLDRLMGFAPLRLDPSGWVAMLFGEITPPPSARVRYDERAGRFVVEWTDPRGAAVEVEVDPHTSRVVWARVRQGRALVSEVEIEERDGAGVPIALHMRAPADDIDVRVRLRDVEHDPDNLGPEQFALQPPRGFTIEELPGTAPADPGASEPGDAEPAAEPTGEPEPAGEVSPGAEATP